MQTARRAAPQSPTPVTTACQLVISRRCGRRPVRCSSTFAPHHVSDAELLAQHPLEMGEVALGAFLAVGDEADRHALRARTAARASWTPAAFLVGGIETRCHASSPVIRADHDRDALTGGSQSTHAPIATVTALVLLPIHGGMTAPKPPPGRRPRRPADGPATRAPYRCCRRGRAPRRPCRRRPIRARRMRARSYRNSAMSRLVQPAAWMCSRSCFGMTMA